MKLTPSILTASVARGSSGSSDASLFSAASLARASSLSSLSSGSSLSSTSSLSSLASSPRNRATLVVASEKGSVTPSLVSPPRNRAPLVGASIKGSVTPSEKGSVTPSPPSNRAPLVGESIKGSVTPSEKGSVTQRERTAFLERYNPQVCRHMALDADRCFRGCAPALEVVRRRYGTQTAVAWVTIQLSETARLWGSSDKIPGEMLEAVAESFVGEYSKLNLAEIGLYLSRLRAGVYGKVAYGKLTPDHLVSNLPTFLAQRSKEIEVYRRNAEREERNRERQRWAERAVSHEVATQMYEEALKHCNNDPDRAIEYLKGLRN